MSSGTSSVPMLPEADVIKTLDMMMILLSKDRISFLRNVSQSVYAEDAEIRSNKGGKSQERWR